MLKLFNDWLRRYFSDPQTVYLVIFIILGFTVVLTMGKMLAPVLAALMVAYLLDGVMTRIVKLGVPWLPTFILVFGSFVALMTVSILTLFPLLWHQLKQLFKELPAIVEKVETYLNSLASKFPEYLSEAQANELSVNAHDKLSELGQGVLSYTLTTLPGVVVWFVYLVLVPLLVFFFLKDKKQLIRWFDNFLPKDRHLANRVWHEVDYQLGNFVKGKIVEAVIVGVATYATFAVFSMKYSALLGFFVGLSVFVPYIGAAVVTVPVALVAFFQYGWTPDFAYLLIAYIVVQALDGNVLVPILFSEAVNMHPIAIVASVLFFGGLWGFWGVFFAIPLAILIKAVLNAWPKEDTKVNDEQFV